MAAVLSGLQKIPDALPVFSHRVVAGTSGLCQILLEKLRIRHCSQRLVNSILTINSRHRNNARKLYPGSTVYLPQITPSHDGMKWRIPVREGVNRRSITNLSFKLSNWNLASETIFFDRSQGDKKKRFTSPQTYYDMCGGEAPANGEEGDYSSYFSTRFDMTNGIRCATPTGALGLPDVVLMDTAIAPHPDIAHALPQAYVEEQGGTGEQARAKQCQRQTTFNQNQHHGTYLTGIIASADNGFGFHGLAERVKISPFHWEDGVEDRQLQDFLETKFDPRKPQIFLFPSEFKPYLPPSERPAYWTRYRGEWLPTLKKHARFKAKPLNIFLVKRKPLFIVSAGQTDDDGLDIGVTTPMSPQNLGDIENVVVVTACENCLSGAARVWSRANHSTARDPLVHLMAPGGEKIPGIVTKDKVGTTIGGTSTAAAFVAGVAARMTQCYPDHYIGFSKRLKERLMLTSFPGVVPSAAEKVAAGVVDPYLSLLDPTTSWLKISGGNLHEVGVRHWCGGQLSMTDEFGNPDPDLSVDLSSVKRIVNMSDQKFVAIRSFWKQHDPRWDILKMKTVGPGHVQANRKLAHVELKPGGPACAIRFNQTDDFILHKSVRAVASCRHVPACGE